MSQKSVLKRTRIFFLTLILFFQLILASAVRGEDVEKLPQKETSFWDVVLFPLNIAKVPVYVLKYSSKPVVSYMDKHPQIVLWLSGALEKHYRRGIYPAFNLSGIEGLKGEIIIFDNHFLLTQNQLKLRLSYSTHAYQNYQLSWGKRNLAPSSFWYHLIFKYSQSPREPFYGLGTHSAKNDKSSFNWEQTLIGVNLGKKLSNRVEIQSQLDFSYNNILKGEQPKILSTTQAYTSSDLPGLSTKIKLLTAKLIFVQDGRDSKGNPRKGGLEKLSLGISEGVEHNQFRFGTADLEMEHLLEIFRHRVLAFRFYAAHTLIPKDSQAPFFSLPYLGGSENLRGYSRNRFTDKGLLLGSIEYRYPVWNNLDGFLFWDEGQVFSNIPNIRLRLFKDSKGGGLRIYDASGLILRAQIGFSREQTKFYLDLEKLF